jgi:hypothetical protein
MSMIERHQTCGVNALLDAKFDNRVAEPMTGERNVLILGERNVVILGERNVLIITG